ncbi:hypothetical protein KR98_20535 [Ralstonia solanacearum]|nr:hypothetical protein KR98_20535 [Ralstonia solanacearum]OCQ66821.1 hypothetical protein AR465_08345 [Ralstonia solanacearum]
MRAAVFGEVLIDILRHDMPNVLQIGVRVRTAVSASLERGGSRPQTIGLCQGKSRRVCHPGIHNDSISFTPIRVARVTDQHIRMVVVGVAYPQQGGV